MSRRIGWRSTLALGVGFAMLAACGASDTMSSRSLAPMIVDHGRDAGAGVAEVTPDRGAVVKAGDLRLLLEELLAVHGTLTSQMMRLATVDDDALGAWIDALAANTGELSAAIGLVYGPAGARAFDQLWSFHTQFFLDYADALRRDDDEGAQLALDGLDDYRDDFASFLSLATGAIAPEAAVVELLDTHIGHMTGQLDAYRRGDLASSLAIEREGHEYLTTIGTTLATAIAAQDPVAFPGDPSDSDAAYCSIVGARLGDIVLTTTASIVIPARFEEGELPERWRTALAAARSDALGRVAEFLGDSAADVEGLDASSSDALAELLGRLAPDSDETAAVDIEELAAFGVNLAGALPDPESIPLIVRDAYARAYRIAAAAPTR